MCLEERKRTGLCDLLPVLFLAISLTFQAILDLNSYKKPNSGRKSNSGRFQPCLTGHCWFVWIEVLLTRHRSFLCCLPKPNPNRPQILSVDCWGCHTPSHLTTPPTHNWANAGVQTYSCFHILSLALSSVLSFVSITNYTPGSLTNHNFRWRSLLNKLVLIRLPKRAMEITKQIFNDYSDFYLEKGKSWAEILINYLMCTTRSNIHYNLTCDCLNLPRIRWTGFARGKALCSWWWTRRWNHDWNRETVIVYDNFRIDSS